MKRLSLLLLLALLPFTLAPRTSLTGDLLTFTVVEPRPSVPAGSAIPYLISATNTGDTDFADVALVLTLTPKAGATGPAVVAASDSCVVPTRAAEEGGALTVTCELGDLALGESGQARLVLRSATPGTLELQVTGVVMQVGSTEKQDVPGPQDSVQIVGGRR